MAMGKWSAVLGTLVLWGVPAEAAAPAIYTIHKVTQLPLAQCVARARAIVGANGFTDVKSATYSTFGFTSEYTIVVRCMPEEKTVFVVVAGGQLAECDRLANKALNEF
jgi:hypothetical protein